MTDDTDWVSTREAVEILGLGSRQAVAAFTREFPILNRKAVQTNRTGRPELHWDRRQLEGIRAVADVLGCQPRFAGRVYVAAQSGALFNAMQQK